MRVLAWLAGLQARVPMLQQARAPVLVVHALPCVKWQPGRSGGVPVCPPHVGAPCAWVACDWGLKAGV